ncbi:MAG: c-type cytochrome [Acidobacteriota bacterium]|nr:c-type cytochrome [Acidobacteriota bacterium]
MRLRRSGWWIFVFLIVAIVAAVWYAATHADISALPEPGKFETALATRLRNWLIDRESRGPLPPAPALDASAISAGSTTFGMACANCHGQDGRKPTPIGRSMYPRVMDLASPPVQSLSDRELFWVIKHGIRLSGMPGFGRINTDQEIWQLTYYVRSLRKNPQSR